MARGETSEVFNCSVSEFYKVVADYEKYPQFLDEVKSCKVIETSGNRKLVEYQVSVLKTFTYRLWMTEKEPHEISWQLASGDVFKESVGHWKLVEEAGKTRASYMVDAKFNMFVPGPVATALVNVNLPNMMSAYQRRIKELYGR